MTASNFKGRTAIITGGSRGIGLAIAQRLAEGGANIVLTSRKQDAADAAAEQVGGDAVGVAAHAVDEDAARHCVDLTLDRFGSIDILVNNAGTNRPRTFLDVTEDDYDAITGLNQRAAYFVAQAVARKMAGAGKGGSIIHISSQMGHVGGQNRTVYCMTKHGIEGLTKAMAIDLAPLGIRVNSIGPTFIDTPLTKPFFENVAFRDDVLRRIKLGRLGTVEDLMGAVVFLAGDAAALITGTALVVDGGWTAE
jgi:NAD(P)-dependent dehydrogenase (short-subunit alcohol dehydrogenase family)